MENILLVDFLNQNIREIKSASELLYIKYLNDYLNERGYSIELGDVTISKQIEETYFYRYVYYSGAFPLDLTEIEDTQERDKRPIYNQLMSDELEFSNTERGVVFDIANNRQRQRSLSGEKLSTGYLNLFAKLQVSFYLADKPMPKMIFRGSQTKINENEFVDLAIMKNIGNRLLKDKIVLEKQDMSLDVDWSAFVHYYHQIGKMISNDYTMIDKKNQLDKQFVPNKTVLFYSLETNIKNKAIRNITSCFPANILSWSDRTVTIEYYPVIQTKATRKHILDELQEKTGVKYLTIGDYELFPKRRETLSLDTVGIDGICNTRYDEYLILPMFDGIDTTKQYIDGKEKELGTIDTIKEVFKDRKIKIK